MNMSSTTMKLRIVSVNNSANVSIHDSLGTKEKPVEETQTQYNDGFNAGIIETEKKYESEIASLKQKISLLSKGLPESIAEYFKTLEVQVKEEICKLSIAISKCILKSKSFRRELVESAVFESINSVNINNTVSIHISPDDEELFSEDKGISLPKYVKIVIDSSLESGSITLDTEQGFIDATLTSRLKEVEGFINDKLQVS